jgi:hypothetical protein
LYIFVCCLGRTQEAAERVEDGAGQPEDDRLAVQVDGRAHRKINYLKKKIVFFYQPKTKKSSPWAKLLNRPKSI